MQLRAKTMTVEEFEAFALHPENEDRLLEFIDGEVVEAVSSNRSSILGAKANYLVGNYVYTHDLGFVTGANGGYRVGNHRFIPNVGFVSKERQAAPSDDAWFAIAPDFAIEVKSPTDRIKRLRQKAERYLDYGTRLVWLVLPKEELVETYRPGQDVEIIGIDGVLDASDVLPGFSVSVRKIFE